MSAFTIFHLCHYDFLFYDISNNQDIYKNNNKIDNTIFQRCCFDLQMIFNITNARIN